MDGNYLSRFITNKSVSRSKIELQKDSKSYVNIFGVSEDILKKIGLESKSKKFSFDAYHTSLLPKGTTKKYGIAPNIARPYCNVFTNKRKVQRSKAKKKERFISEEAFKTLTFDGLLYLNKDWLSYYKKATKNGSVDPSTIDLHFSIMKKVSTNLPYKKNEESITSDEFMVIQETKNCFVGINRENKKVVLKKKDSIFAIVLKDDVLIFFGNNEIRKSETRSFKKFKDKDMSPVLDELYKFRGN